MAAFVRDGYTRDCFIKAYPEKGDGEKIYEAVNFKYRVASGSETRLHTDIVGDIVREDLRNKTNSGRSEPIACKFIADHLVSWDIKDGAEDVPISQENIKFLQPDLWNKIYLIIRNQDVGDQAPGAEKPPLSAGDLAKNS